MSKISVKGPIRLVDTFEFPAKSLFTMFKNISGSVQSNFSVNTEDTKTHKFEFPAMKLWL